MLDNYELWEAHERREAQYERRCIQDCEGVLIAPNEPFWEIDGKIYAHLTMDNYKHFWEG